MATKTKKTDDSPKIQKLSEMKEEKFIPWGIPELDEITGGIPKSRITELWGPAGIGKTHTLCKIMAANADKKILIVDAEFSLNAQRMATMGVKTENVDFLQDAQLERVTELILASVGKYDIIMLDSIAFLTPLTIETQEVGENAIGLFSRQIKHFAVKLRPRLGSSKTALVVVNQMRAVVGGTMFEQPKPLGGMAWLHAVDLRLKLQLGAANKIESKGVQVGHKVTAQVVKSKVSQPFGKAVYEVIY